MHHTHQPRRRRTESEWRQLLARQAESNQTIEQFCRHEGMSVGSFYRWKNRLNETPVYQSESTVSNQRANFIDLGTLGETPTPRESEAAGWHLELDLGHGRILRFRSI